MQIFKFGGASVKDAEGYRNVAGIINKHKGQPLLVIVSASGKTTNALEDVVNAFWKKTGDTKIHLDKVKKHHEQILKTLFDEEHSIYDEIHDLYTELDWVLEGNPTDDSYDYLYDQVVSVGEFLSSKILAAYLNQVSIKTHWLDARDIIKTDDRWREPAINWEQTELQAKKLLPNLLKDQLIVSQGFVGCTSDNMTTTLGREGSDFSAAIFAYCLRAQGMTIWKDVPGVLNADPRLFPEAIKLDKIDYEEAIEMTYYGAQVIHPKTMRPLQIRNIPLFVKCFLKPEAPGTVVDGSKVEIPYPPVIVVKKEQALLTITSKDFYFIDEPKMANLFAHFANHRLKVNLLQNSAMSLVVCVDNKPENISALTLALIVDFHIEKQDNLELITIRHYNNDILNGLKYGKSVVVEERTPITCQLIVKK